MIQLQDSLIEQLRLKRITVNHGLDSFSSLRLEEVIRSCFRNPRRHDYPRFLIDQNWGSEYSLAVDHLNSSQMIKQTGNAIIQKFNNLKIVLQNTAYLNKIPKECDSPEKARLLYSEELSRSAWYGPYQ